MNEGFDTYVPGQVIKGKFKVISRLGSGGMGTVYRIEQIFLKKEFALKTMDRTDSNVMVQRFQLEAKAASSLNHPNLVKVHDYGILDNETPYLLMDFINGITFADYLKKHGPIALELVAPLFTQACFGLLAAHEKNVVHRDIKPANLMLLNDVGVNTEGSVKVVDFGIAKFVNRDEGEVEALTRTGEIFGSPLYMSPEQCSGGFVDHRSDIYSLGCVLFEMLTGTPPHMGPNALKTMLLHQAGETPTLKEASLGIDFPESLQQIVMRMLRKQPEQRYQSIDLVAQDLRLLESENYKPAAIKPATNIQEPLPTPPKVISITPTRLITLLVVIGAFAAVSISATAYLINNQRPKSTNISQTISTKSSPGIFEVAEEAEATASGQVPSKRVLAETQEQTSQLDHLAPIKEMDITTNNKTRHVFLFPEISLGKICAYKFDDFRTTIHHAQGTVSIPAETPIGLKVSDHEALLMLRSPSVFGKIPGKDFQSLVIDVPKDFTSLVADTDPLSPEKLKHNVEEALCNLHGWTNLTVVMLKDCSLTQKALNALNEFKKLQSLELGQCNFDPVILAKQPFLLKLSKVALYNDSIDYAPIIKQLSISSNLKRLCVNKLFSTDEIRDLRRCASLVTIEIRTKKIDDEAIALICTLKQVKNVRLFGVRPSDEQIRMFQHCSWISEIMMDRPEDPIDAQYLKALDNRISLLGE
jgi:serine/threonine protein kinase